MTHAPSTTSLVPGIARGSVRCALAAVSVVVVAAAIVSLAGLADDTRRMLRFGFGGVYQSPVEAACIAAQNARFAAGTLVCAGLAPRLKPRGRRLVDVLLATLLAFNAGAVGIAIGAYGTRAISATALHLPVEFSALSLAGGAYMQACKQPLSARALTGVAMASGLLLVVAATVETYASIGGAR